MTKIEEKLYATFKDKSNPIKSVDQFKSITKILDQLYIWDFFLTHVKNDIYKIEIVIYIKELEISNSKGLKHQIKGLLVFLPFDCYQGNWYITNILGCRTYLSYKEYCSKYRHSHLSVSNVSLEDFKSFKKDEFCLNTELINILFNLKYKYDSNTFELFLLSLGNYLEWESLEGVPFRRIEDLGVYDFDDIIKTKDYYNDFNKIWKNFDLMKFEYGINNNRYYIKETKIFNNILRKEVISNKLYDLLCIRDNNIYYYYIPGKKKIIKKQDLSGYFINFRDDRIHLKIEYNDHYIPNIDSYKVYPKFSKYVIDRLENYINHESIRANCIRRYNYLKNR